MSTSELPPYTTDARVHVQAESLDGLFDRGLQCMNKLLVKDYFKKSYKAVLCQEIEIRSVDTRSLLIDFLSKALSLSQTHKAIFFLLSCDRINPSVLEGVLIGSRVPSIDTEIKGVTYSDAEVKRNENGQWEAVIVFEI